MKKRIIQSNTTIIIHMSTGKLRYIYLRYLINLIKIL